MDALSGAFVAFKHFQTLLRKIRTHLRQANKEALFERVAEIVIKKEIPISSAVEEVERPVVLREPRKPIKPVLVEVSKLQEKLANARIDSAMLKKQLEQALESVRVVQKRYQELKRKTALLVKPKKPEARIREKESRIKFLGRKVTTLSKELEHAKKAVSVLEKALARIDNRVVVKKLARLGWDDIQKQKDFLFEGDVLLVDDPNQYSDSAVAWLKEQGIDVVLCKKPVSSRVAELLPFAFLPADLEIEEFERVALVDKEQLAKLRRSKQFLKKLVEKYREERTSK
jgi:predicted RNase H-like nuclease (RuvC/YqgF family)